MLFTLFPSATFAQTGFDITNSYGDLAVNYVQFNDISLERADISISNSDIKIARDEWEWADGKFLNVALYYHGPLNWGTKNRTETEDAILGLTNIPGSIVLRWSEGAILSDGTKADVRITIDNYVIAAGAKPAGMDENAEVNCIFLDSATEENDFVFRTQRMRTGMTIDTVFRNQMAHSYDVKVEILQAGTNQSIDVNKYPTMIFGAIDMDITDHTTAQNNDDRYAGKYSEGMGLISGFSGPIYLTNDTLCVVQTVDGNTKVRGTAIDESTMNSGFAMAASTQGFKFKWYGSTAPASSGSGNMATGFCDFEYVSVTATSGEGGSIEKEGNTTYIVNSKTEYEYIPEDGYRVASLKVEGADVPFNKEGGVYTFDKLTPKADGMPYEIDVQFERKDYRVIYESDEGGEITGKIDEYRDPNEKATGTNQKDKETFKFTHYVADVDVTLDNGTVIPSGDSIMPEQVERVVVNSNVTFTAIHERIPVLTIEKKSDKDSYNVSEEITYEIIVTESREGAIAKDVVIRENFHEGVTVKSINFNRNPDKVEGENYSWNELPYGEEIKIEIIVKLDPEKIVEEIFENIVTVNSSNAEPQEAERTIERTVHVKTKVINGEITESSSEMSVGSSYEVTYQPNPFFKLKSITVNGEEVDIKEYPDEYNFEGLLDNAEIEVIYEPITHVIKTDVVNGEITNDMIVPHGDNAKIIYSPKDGYYIKSVTVDGKEVDVEKYPTEYVFENVTQDHEIKTIYEPISYEIKTIVKNGTISEGGTTLFGENMEIAYKPNDGFKLKTIKVDGVEVSIKEFKEKYLFENISSDHVIEVIYEEVPEQIVEVKEEVKPIQEPVKEKVDPPKTGDTNNMFIYMSLGAVSLFTLAGLRKYRKKEIK